MLKKACAFLLVMLMVFAPFAPGITHAQTSTTLAKRLAGKFLLQVENDGVIWYVSPKDYKRYEIRFDNIVDFVDTHGSGILKKDIDKIPIKAVSLPHYDDTDQDGHPDRDEVLNGYDPYEAGEVKLPIDKNFAQKHIGTVFIEVDGHGRLWYVDDNAERWNLDWSIIMKMLKTVSLGITNADLEKIPQGEPLESRAPDAHINCRDSLDCLIAASYSCMNSSAWFNESVEYDRMDIDFSFSVNMWNEAGQCKFNVWASSSYPQLDSDLYDELHTSLTNNGYTWEGANDYIYDYVTDSWNYYTDTIDETYAQCTLVNSDFAVNTLKNHRMNGLVAYDALFNVTYGGDHPCYSRFYGYDNPSESANGFYRSFVGLANLHHQNILSEIDYINNLSYDDYYSPYDPYEPVDEEQARIDRNNERRSDINELLTISRNLCTAGHTSIEPINAYIVTHPNGNSYVEIDDSIANSNITTEWDPSYILDPLNIGICGFDDDSPGCEYTIVLNSQSKTWNACDPYLLYELEQPDGNYSLGCASNSFIKEGITDINACR